MLGAADARHHRQMSPSGPGLTSGLLNGWEKFARRIGMGPIAEDDIEQDDRCRGFLRSSENPLAAQRTVDHWMRASESKLILTQIDDGVSLPSAQYTARHLR